MNWIPFSFIRRHLLDDIEFHEIVDELKDYDDRFFQIVRKRLAVLGIACLIELVIILPLLFYVDGAWWYFMVMTLSWAVINYYIVLWIFNHILLSKFVDPDPFERFEAQRHVENMLFINIGLDVAYIFAGLWIRGLGQIPDTAFADLWTGFGWAIVFQGVYLFFQDNLFHRLHSINIRKALPFFKALMLSELQYRERKKLEANK